MIDINVKGLLICNKTSFTVLCSVQNSGHIINVGSIAGKEVYPKGNVYCASKFAVDALSEGMRLDLVEKNIKGFSNKPRISEHRIFKSEI